MIRVQTRSQGGGSSAESWFTNPSDAVYGIAGDGLVDDFAAWQALIEAVPDGSAIMVTDPAANFLLSDTLTFTNKKNITLRTVTGDARNNIPAAAFQWGGGNHGTMLSMIRNELCRIEGFAWYSGGNTVDTAINIDGEGGPGISTKNTVRGNQFGFTQVNTDTKMVSIGATTTTNNESMDVSHNDFQLSSSARPADAGVAIYVGPNTNAKHQKFHHNNIQKATIGVYARAGSFDIYHFGGGFNGTDIKSNCQDACSISHHDAELSTVLVENLQTASTLTISNGRLDNGEQTNAGGYLKLSGNVTIFGCSFAERPPGGGTLIENTGQLRLAMFSNKWADSTTYAESGLDVFEDPAVSHQVLCSNNSNQLHSSWPSRYFFQCGGVPSGAENPQGWVFLRPPRIKARTYNSITDSGNSIPGTLGGTLAVFSNSTTNTPGATITGGGAFEVLGAFVDGAWKVVV